MLLIVGLFLLALLCQAHDDHDHEDERIDSLEHQHVTCGTVLKLRNLSCGYRLHSHQVTYGSGSGQQSVTGFPGSDDNNSYWVVKGPFGSKECITGTPVANGDSIRLEHLSTNRNLHSHLHSSPLSHQQEVSCFGENENGDTSDNWVVKPVNNSPYWTRGAQVRFQHQDTNKYLQMTSSSFGNPIPGQREVVCSTKQTEDTKWTSEEGIYFPHARIN